MTTFRAWKVAELVRAVSDTQSNVRIVIPTFQRNFVWSAAQRDALIWSIRNDYPIGALLLYRSETGNGGTRLQLVDGLQRTVTLKKYLDNVLKSIRSSDLPPNDIRDIAAMLSAGAPQHDCVATADLIATWFNEQRSFLPENGYSNLHLLGYLLGRDLFSDAPQLLVRLQLLLDKVRDSLDVSNYEIPVIEFSGNIETLPDIFDRLNAGGTKLAKYDILAANWDDKYIAITDNQLISAVKSKYRELLALGLEFDSTNEHFEQYDSTYDYLIFEFVFALGRCLKTNFPRLFGKQNDASTEVDSVGFNLVALSSGLRIAQLGRFADIIMSIDNGDRYFQAIQEAATVVQEALGPLLAFPLEKESHKKLPHTEFQIASLVASVFRLMFEPNLQAIASWKAAHNEVANNIRTWYLYDLLRKYWRNAGDAKAFDSVSRLQILQPVVKSAFEASLDAWFEEALRSRTTELQSVSRALLKLTAGYRLKTMPNANKKFLMALIVDPNDLSGSGITPKNPFNVVLLSPESSRRFDPAGLSGAGLSRNHGDDATAFFRARFVAMKAYILTNLAPGLTP